MFLSLSLLGCSPSPTHFTAEDLVESTALPTSSPTSSPTISVASSVALTDPGCEQEDDAPSFDFTTSPKMLAIGVYASDETALATSTQFDNYFNQDGYGGEFGVAEWLHNSSNELVDVEFVTEVVALTKTQAIYAADQFLAPYEAVDLLDDAGFDFTQLADRLETDAGAPFTKGPVKFPITIVGIGDGTEAIIGTPAATFTFIGPPGSDPNSHRVDEQYDPVHFVYTATYITPSTPSADVLFHELGHSFFEVSEYYGNRDPDFGIGDFGPMGTGFRMPLNPLIRQCNDWVNVVDIAGLPTGAILTMEFNDDDDYIYRWRTASRPDEYFLLEAVRADGEYKHAPDDGLYIWHVDETQDGPSIDTAVTPHRLAFEQADGLFGIETIANDQGGAGDAFTTGDTFGASSTPNSNYNDGTSSGLDITQITVDLTNDQILVTF